MIIVMTGIRVSHLLTKREGMGSSGQDFNAEFWISDLTFLSDKVFNADNVGNTLAALSTEIDASWTVKSVISASICHWVVSTFVTKYSPIWLAKVGACRLGGSPSSRD